MDVVLERVLSLIPKKDDGKYVHGAKNEFTDKIGAPRNSVSNWIAGKNNSYTKYLYQIADVYKVSVDWLKGETDEKNPRPQETDGKLALAISLLVNAPDDLQEKAINVLIALLAANK